ncbi:amidohydrolase family protein [Roseivirga sp. UBA1976]|uniref:amidohydrolase family protein n=1 Tax=Roseivirga sp. UBA1976 TaxID=1947386 RepID=UPI00257E5A1A|nr:amidohydrolase family protein [Roseivirga sp. UBA1976]|tara:strand:- start:22036 stop:23118 length:1083 start_codon:yes stop_codon:yes gene_type:complete
MKKTFLSVVAISLLATTVSAQTVSFEEYNPPSSLVVPENPVQRAKYPFIDVHSHQWRMGERNLNELAAQMDSLNMGLMVNLSGGSGKAIADAVTNIEANQPKRFVVFANLNFNNFDGEWGTRAAEQLERDVTQGAKGLKIFKSLGFSVKDSDGNRVAVDDPRLDPVWAKCGELGIPVLIHTADPKQFWEPFDANNERWLELKTHPRRKREADDPAPWETLIQEQHNVFKKHPNTIFIAAHMGWFANDLAKLGQLLDEMPNMMVEIGAVIAELGRQPRMANAFFQKYQDRVLFGKDAYNPEEYHTYFRVLETKDEYFPYYKKYHAFWRMYGLGLPDEILKKVYYKNALRIIPGLYASQFPN